MARSTERQSGLRSALLVVVVAFAAASCDALPESSSSTAAVTAPPTTAAPPGTTAVSTSSTPPVDQLTSCVEHAKFQAFTGNEFWSGMWAEAGQTDAGMREVCTFLGDGQPGFLQQVHEDWLRLRQTVEPTITALVSTTRPVFENP